MRCRRGATIVEFALLAPVFLTMLFGIIEYSRFSWSRQTLQEVAYNTARCLSVEVECKDAGRQRRHAIERAASYGYVITTDDIEINNGARCRNIGNANSVRINAPFSSPVHGLLPFLPKQILTEACFPVME